MSKLRERAGAKGFPHVLGQIKLAVKEAVSYTREIK
jgi:hypothetical protein